MGGPSVVAMGDSITVGVGDTAVEGHAGGGWAAHVATALGSTSFNNLAANGVRVRDLAHSQLPSALMAQPDLVLLSAGGNDVLRGDFDPVEIAHCLRSVLDRLDRPGRSVVVMSLDHIRLCEVLPRPVASVMRGRIDRANDALRDAVAGTPTTLVDGPAVMRKEGPAGWHIDRIHPSARGHRALAQAALDALHGTYCVTSSMSAPAPTPLLREQAWWLARHGTPWMIKRSRDLIPHIAQVVTHEILEERRSQISTRKGGVGASARRTPPEERGLDQPAVLLNDI